VADLFFVLSGEFETLPASELSAILETEEFSFKLTEKLDQTIRLTSSRESVQEVSRRSAYTRICALELFSCKAEENLILEQAKNIDYSAELQEGNTFEVRIRRLKNYNEEIETVPLERKLGQCIKENAPKAKVNLTKPNKTFYGILTEGKLVFGLKLAEIEPKPFVERRPRKKPFFHPSAMSSKLARCMVNLAHAKTGDLALDPFCGTGTAVMEAAMIGCRAIGADIQKRMVIGCRKNLKHFSINPEGLLVADARQPTLTKIDCVVTDPPYGRASTCMKSNTGEIVKKVLSSSFEMLDSGHRICIASPKTLNIASLGKDLGYRHLESHFAYVHRTLTREVAVFEKP
jgi:tRNA (guanine10-N2)-dimethyltransferase